MSRYHLQQRRAMSHARAERRGGGAFSRTERNVPESDAAPNWTSSPGREGLVSAGVFALPSLKFSVGIQNL